MANKHDKNEGNVPGPFYIDSSCVDCDMCRLIAATFSDVHPMQRWLVEFLEAVVVHGDDDVAGALAAARLLDELRAASDD